MGHMYFFPGGKRNCKSGEWVGKKFLAVNVIRVGVLILKNLGEVKTK